MACKKSPPSPEEPSAIHWGNLSPGSRKINPKSLSQLNTDAESQWDLGHDGVQQQSLNSTFLQHKHNNLSEDVVSVSDLLPDSEPDDDDEELFFQQLPICPPSPRHPNSPKSRVREADHSPYRLSTARRLKSPKGQHRSPGKKRLRIILRPPNAAEYLRKARCQAIAHHIPGIYLPEEYDPDHDPFSGAPRSRAKDAEQITNFQKELKKIQDLMAKRNGNEQA